MEELIKVIEKNEQQVISARELHEFIVKKAKGGQVGEMFAHWIQRMLDYGFKENIDYTILEYNYKGDTIFSKSDIQYVSKRDYILTMNCAKEIAMVQNNDKGQQARRYFIKMEKKAKTSLDSISRKELGKMIYESEEEKEKL